MGTRVRTPLSFPLDGLSLAATLDEGPRATGLLVVTGGTQVRVGPHRSLALLAAVVAEAGYPVFRFDRRGVGDSEGEDPGFAASGPDIAAAAAEFRRRCPQLRHIAGFGLCDGATALALHHEAAGVAALLLANPWVVEARPGLPPPAAIRRHYLQRLTTRRGWKHLLRGAVDLRKAARGLRAATSTAPSNLAHRVGKALGSAETPVTLILAEGDATAIAFDAEYRKPAFAALRDRAERHSCPTGSHSFAGASDRLWLARIVIQTLDRLEETGRH
jgi:exosortase A-associated hydrolase 1